MFSPRFELLNMLPPHLGLARHFQSGTARNTRPLAAWRLLKLNPAQCPKRRWRSDGGSLARQPPERTHTTTGTDASNGEWGPAQAAQDHIRHQYGGGPGLSRAAG